MILLRRQESFVVRRLPADRLLVYGHLEEGRQLLGVQLVFEPGGAICSAFAVSGHPPKHQAQVLDAIGLAVAEEKDLLTLFYQLRGSGAQAADLAHLATGAARAYLVAAQAPPTGADGPADP